VSLRFCWLAVVTRTYLQTRVLPPELIRMESVVRLCAFRCLAIASKTENVGDDFPCLGNASSSFHSQSHLDVWLRLLIRVLFGILAQAL